MPGKLEVVSAMRRILVGEHMHINAEQQQRMDTRIQNQKDLSETSCFQHACVQLTKLLRLEF